MSADLGGRRVKVVSLAGHTRGSVGLLLEDEGLLLAGDGLNPTLLMLGPESATFAQLRTTLEAVEQLPFERYLASHGTPGPLPRRRWASICGIWIRSAGKSPPIRDRMGLGWGGAYIKKRAGARSFCLTGACSNGKHKQRKIAPGCGSSQPGAVFFWGN